MNEILVKKLDRKLIVALDDITKSSTEILNKALDVLDINNCAIFKIGSKLWVKFGPKLIEKFQIENIPVFLDLKICDIDSVVKDSLNFVFSNYTNVLITTVHHYCLVDVNDFVSKFDNKLIACLSVLTSLTDFDLAKLGINHNLASSSAKYVSYLFHLIFSLGYNAVVCSPKEAYIAKALTSGKIVTICPGIVEDSSISNDQRRAISISEIDEYFDDVGYFVVGRALKLWE